MGTRILALLLLCGVGLFAETPAPKKIQTLLVSGQNRHDWKTVNPELRRMLEETV